MFFNKKNESPIKKNTWGGVNFGICNCIYICICCNWPFLTHRTMADIQPSLASPPWSTTSQRWAHISTASSSSPNMGMSRWALAGKKQEKYRILLAGADRGPAGQPHPLPLHLLHHLALACPAFWIPSRCVWFPISILFNQAYEGVHFPFIIPREPFVSIFNPSTKNCQFWHRWTWTLQESHTQ